MVLRIAAMLVLLLANRTATGADSLAVEPEFTPGLYQSGPMSIVADKPDGTQSREQGMRLFLRIYPRQTAVTILSSDPAEEVDRYLVEGFHAGEFDYTVSDGALVFNTGPTRHLVQWLAPGKLRIRFEYANGNSSERDLSLFVPVPP